MHPGPLFAAMVLMGAISPVALPQNSSATAPVRESQEATSQPPPLPSDPNQFVHQAIRHELEEQDHDQTLWRYRLHREDDKNNVDRDVIETHEGRMQQQISDPDERARHEKREKEDGVKARQMLSLIPEAFNFRYAGEENGLVKLAFVPNPHFDPPNFEAKVYKSLKGILWIERDSMRLAGIDGTLFEDVNFGWGLLGHLNKGGTFCVRQKDVGDGHWDVVSEEVNMVGRAVIFKTITRKQKQSRTDWRRVPDSITIQQAYQMLERDPGSLPHSQDTSELRR